MGFIRGGLLIIVCILLFLSFLVGNVLFTISSSLKYENIQYQIGPVIEELVYEQIDLTEIEESFEVMRSYCQNNSEFVMAQEGYTFVIPCEEIITGTTESVVNSQLSKFVGDVYYKDYDCSFLDCFKENDVPFFLVSDMSHDYFRNKFYYSLLISAFLILLAFFLVENKKNLLIIAGALLVASSLPFMKLGSLVFSSNEILSKVLIIFLTGTYKTFLITFVIGLIILSVGIGLRFWSFGKDFKSRKLDKKIVEKGKKRKFQGTKGG